MLCTNCKVIPRVRCTFCVDENTNAIKLIGKKWRAAGLDCFRCICRLDGIMECQYILGAVTNIMTLFTKLTCVSYKCVAALNQIMSETSNKTNMPFAMKYQCSVCYNEGKTYYLIDTYSAGNPLNNTIVLCSCELDGWTNCRVSYKRFGNLFFNLRCTNCTTSEAINIFYPKGK